MKSSFPSVVSDEATSFILMIKNLLTRKIMTDSVEKSRVTTLRK